MKSEKGEARQTEESRAIELAEEVAREVGGQFWKTHMLNTGLLKFIVRARAELSKAQPSREAFEKAREDFAERWADPDKRSIVRASFMAGWQAREIGEAPKWQFFKSLADKVEDGEVSIDELCHEESEPIYDLIERFSTALLEKLLAAEQKYDWDNGWRKDDWADKLRSDIRKHVEKGDPRDVAAYCAFAWHHGWSLAKATIDWCFVCDRPKDDCGCVENGGRY